MTTVDLHHEQANVTCPHHPRTTHCTSSASAAFAGAIGGAGAATAASFAGAAGGTGAAVAAPSAGGAGPGTGGAGPAAAATSPRGNSFEFTISVHRVNC